MASKIKINWLSEEVMNEHQDLHDFRIQLDDGGEVSCSKFLVCIRSPVIKGMIPLKKYQDTKTLRLEGYKTDDIQMVIGLLETGSMIITDAGVRDYFLSILESLQIPAVLEESGAGHQNLKTENQDSPEFTAIKIDYEVLVKYKDSTKVRCEPCNKDYQSMYAARRHCREEHGPSQGPVECHICGKSFKKQDSLGAHRRKKHNYRVSQFEKKKPLKPNTRIKKE